MRLIDSNKKETAAVAMRLPLFFYGAPRC